MLAVAIAWTAIISPAAAGEDPGRAGGLPKPRLIVLTDVGGDPDDQQSMIRLMLYAGEFDVEGLIASAAGTPGELKEEVTRPELIRQIVEAYGQVRPNLLVHDSRYPTQEYLLERITSGNPRRGQKNLGDGHDSEGSRWIVAVVDRPDSRPVNVAIWGGSTDLAQALWRVRHDRPAAEVKQFLAKLRVYAIYHQDDTGPWIVEDFPPLFYVLGMAPRGRDRRESVFRGMYLGGNESLTSRAWIDRHVRHEHGPLGALYPAKTATAPNPHGALKEGDTPSWFYFLPNGLSDPAHPEWGSWGGRFLRAAGGLYRDAQDRVGGELHARATVWRWRAAFQNDFQARVDWCLKPYAAANHTPRAVLNGEATGRVLEIAASPGDAIRLTTAGSSDPDGNRLSYHWWIYPEAGTYGGEVPIAAPGRPEATLTIPADAAGKEIHAVLELTDDGLPPLTAYRRAVIRVRQ